MIDTYSCGHTEERGGGIMIDTQVDTLCPACMEAYLQKMKPTREEIQLLDIQKTLERFEKELWNTSAKSSAELDKFRADLWHILCRHDNEDMAEAVKELNVMPVPPFVKALQEMSTIEPTVSSQALMDAEYPSKAKENGPCGTCSCCKSGNKAECPSGTCSCCAPVEPDRPTRTITAEDLWEEFGKSGIRFYRLKNDTEGVTSAHVTLDTLREIMARLRGEK